MGNDSTSDVWRRRLVGSIAFAHPFPLQSLQNGAASGLLEPSLAGSRESWGFAGIGVRL